MNVGDRVIPTTGDPFLGEIIRLYDGPRGPRAQVRWIERWSQWSPRTTGKDLAMLLPATTQTIMQRKHEQQEKYQRWMERIA